MADFGRFLENKIDPDANYPIVDVDIGTFSVLLAYIVHGFKIVSKYLSETSRFYKAS